MCPQKILCSTGFIHELLKENEEEKEEAVDDLVGEADDNDNAAEDLFDIDMVGGDETENEEIETVTTTTMTWIELPMKTTKTWFIISVISSDDNIGQRAENKSTIICKPRRLRARCS